MLSMLSMLSMFEKILTL